MEPVSDEPRPPAERPRSVTIVGWIFLALSSLRFLEDLWGWVIWKLGDPEPVLRFFMPRDARTVVPLLVMRNFAAIVAVQGVVALCVAVIAYNFLRLRAWARPALEIVCWLALAIVTGIACALGYARASLAATLAGGLHLVIFGFLVVDLLLGAAIWTIRSPRVRAAFRSSRDRTA